MHAMPTLFVSHGAPTLALEPGRTGPMLQTLGQQLPHPSAILAISPHWSTATPRVGHRATQSVLHDFSGFPAPLYALNYPAAGAPALAERTVTLLCEAGLDAALDDARGLDHGAWVPLRYLYPNADVPVTQLSLQRHQPPAYHYRLGQQLAPLARDGVLVMASGSFTHNLRDLRMTDGDSREAHDSYADEFAQWFIERMQAGDLDALFDYRARAPHATRAHPSDEHLLPLFVAMGASDDWTRHTHLDTGSTYGVLRMDAFVFADAARTV